MSKASEWAKELKARPALHVHGIFGKVNDDGSPYLRTDADCALSVEAVLELARWILDTFGDHEQS